MEYYLSGKKIDAGMAWTIIYQACLNAGHDIEEIRAIWESRDDEIHGEESRDMLFDLSGYSLEIIADDQD